MAKFEYKTEKNGSAKTLYLIGKLDKLSSGIYEAELIAAAEDVTELTLDFSGLVYITSAGLRILFTLNEIMNEKGTLSLRGVSADIMSVLDMTGFSSFLHFETA